MDTPPARPLDRGANSPEFSLVRDDVLYRLQHALHLLPRNGRDGIVRRAIVLVLLTWLPLVIWAVVTGHAFGKEGEPLLQHYSVHARFLIALPALILGEKLSRTMMKRLLPQFLSMELISEEKEPAFREVITRMIRMRNSTLPWIAIGAVILLWLLIPETGHRMEELSWARVNGHLGFGGWWYLSVSRPIFQLFLFAWIWRIVLLGILLRRIVALGLNPIATHPDRLGGLGFVGKFPMIFGPFAFALSCLLASKWAHDIAWHGAHVTTFKMQGILYLVMLVAVCLAPLAVFFPLLKKTKRKALADYGRLTSLHGRLVRQQWIEGVTPADRSLLEAPEFGPTCDINALYGGIQSMRIIPFTKTSILYILLPAAIPMTALLSMEIPIMDLLGKIFKTLL